MAKASTAAQVEVADAESASTRVEQRPAIASKSAPALAMQRLGLVRGIDLALHLPLRYEDETRITPVAALRDGETAQAEVVVCECRVEQRSRRQLLVRVADDSGELLLRFLNFYPAQQKALAVGKRLRVRGEVRGGFMGREMVHPAYKTVDDSTPLPSTLTPVYPSSAQLPQAYLRKAIASALARTPLPELITPAFFAAHSQTLSPTGLPSLSEAVHFLHHPPAHTDLASLDDRSHIA